MPSVARDRSLDSSIAFLREGYEFGSNRCRRYETDAFETRLLLQPVVFMQGEEPARVFYSERFVRKGAMPLPTLTLLQDLGSAAVLEGPAHRHRKRMFLSLMTPDGLRRLADISADEWRISIERWRRADHVVLLDAVQELLCRTACAWAGVPLGEPEARERTAEFVAMIEGAGSFGARNVRGHLKRRKTEEWATEIIRRIRAGTLDAAEGTAARTIASHRDLDGNLLEEDVAAVELINVLRPTVAVAWFVTFAAHALQEQPELREQLGSDAADLVEPFVHEVRRFYPLFLAVPARVAQPFEWRDYRFPTRRRVLLDIYGTNHDPRIWEEPDTFRPGRFHGWDGNPFTLIPQGGGDHAESHRCAGEWATVELMKTGVQALRMMRYDVPPQDLRIPLSRMPARPMSGFVIRDVQGA
jgi:fatty-acid peroxygenase